MKKTRKIEDAVKAPDTIRKGVQNTLDTYRLVGDVAGLYIDGMAQTLLGFTDLIKPVGTDLLLDYDNNKEEDPTE